MPVLVAVGGSGQHVALAALRLVELGALPASTRLFVLDADNRGELSKSLLHPWPGVDGAQTHPLGLGEIVPPFDRVAKDEATFDDLFVDAAHPRQRDLFELLFDAPEAAISVDKGMYGTPCVGASVFADGAENPAVKSIIAGLKGSDGVFFTGSVVGGTGAGILHKLVARVRGEYDGPAYGIFLLPWFEVPPEGGEGAVTPAVIRRNLAHGLAYFFDHTVPNLSCSVFLGKPAGKTRVIKDLHLGQGDMSEHPHYLHLVAAHCMLGLPGASTAGSIKAYGYAHNDQDEGWLLGKTWHGEATLRERVFCAMAQRALLDHVAENGQKVRKTVKPGLGSIIASADSITTPLYQSIVKNADLNKQTNVDYADQILAEFNRIRGSLQNCLTWLRDIYPEELLGTKPVLVQELAKKDEAGKWKRLRGWWEPVLPTEHPRAATEVARQLAAQISQKALEELRGRASR